MSLHLSLELPPTLIARLEALADSNATSLDQIATLLLTQALDDRSAWVTGEDGFPLFRNPADLESDPPGEPAAPLMRGCLRGSDSSG